MKNRDKVRLRNIRTMRNLNKRNPNNVKSTISLRMRTNVKTNEQKTNEQKTNEQKTNEQKTNEQKANEQKANEQKGNEQKTDDKNSIDSFDQNNLKKSERSRRSSQSFSKSSNNVDQPLSISVNEETPIEAVKVVPNEIEPLAIQSIESLKRKGRPRLYPEGFRAYHSSRIKLNQRPRGRPRKCAFSDFRSSILNIQTQNNFVLQQCPVNGKETGLGFSSGKESVSSNFNVHNNLSEELKKNYVKNRISMDASNKLKVLQILKQVDNVAAVSRQTGINATTIKYWKENEDKLIQQANEQSEISDLNKNQFTLENNSEVPIKLNPLNINENNLITNRGMINAKNVIKKENIQKKLGNTKYIYIPNITALFANKPLELNGTKSQSPEKDIVTEPEPVLSYEEITRKIKEETNKLVALHDNNRSLTALCDYFSDVSTVDKLVVVPPVSQSISLSTPSQGESVSSGSNNDNGHLTKLKISVSSKNYALLPKQHSQTSINSSTTVTSEFLKIIVEFFNGEYQLLRNISQEYQQLIKCSQDNVEDDTEELKNYYTFSINRLKELQKQIS